MKPWRRVAYDEIDGDGGGSQQDSPLMNMEGSHCYDTKVKVVLEKNIFQILRNPH